MPLSFEWKAGEESHTITELGIPIMNWKTVTTYREVLEETRLP